MILRDKYGWPIERVKGKYFYNFMRTLFQLNLYQTFKKRIVKPETIFKQETTND